MGHVTSFESHDISTPAHAEDWSDSGHSAHVEIATTEVPCTSLPSLLSSKYSLPRPLPLHPPRSSHATGTAGDSSDDDPATAQPSTRGDGGRTSVLVVDAEGLDEIVVTQALDLPEHERPYIIAFEHLVSTPSLSSQCF